ncbi:hypothetical protein [Aminobacter sp. HY435]|uniref:hypothetical protein n=1 Tax=Aminobacter sp. HY435 TaxID=2970917 RepID=UPI0022B94765|nr:hypothetical protein [Aminobacter sp. HY435]
MSIMSTIGRYGAAIRKARRDARSVRDLNSLPIELQKDIGWPAEQDARTRKLHSSIFPGR